MNDVNLEQFQFEYDLTWMSFFQSPAGVTYTRYGGRDDTHADSHLSKESLVRTMRKVLELHQSDEVQPESKYEPRPSKVSTPRELPAMKKMMAKRKESCIHCHDVKNATLIHLRDQNKLEKRMVFTYPSPKNLGIQLDRDMQTEIAKVIKGSPAEKAGLKAGDRINKVMQQRVLTYGDVTRVLELQPDDLKELTIDASRGQRTANIKVALPEKWKTASDPSWRASVGIVGPSSGFWGKPLSDAQRRNLKIPRGKMGVRINFIWGKWTRKAGVKQNDVLVELDGKTDDFSIRQVQAYLQMNKEFGDPLDLVVLRGGERVKLKMKLPGPQND